MTFKKGSFYAPRAIMYSNLRGPLAEASNYQGSRPTGVRVDLFYVSIV